MTEFRKGMAVELIETWPTLVVICRTEVTSVGKRDVKIAGGKRFRLDGTTWEKGAYRWRAIRPVKDAKP